MKPIIIIGKGPSSRKVKKSDKYDVATVNNTIWLCDSPTYAFFNDVELFCLCKKKILKIFQQLYALLFYIRIGLN